MTTTPIRPVRPAEPSTGELVHRATEQVTRLVKDELALAKAEMANKSKQAGVGVGMFGGSGLLAAYGLGVLIAAAVLALTLVWPAWLAALAVAGGVFLIAGLLALIARARLKKAVPPVPAETISSLKADMAQLKERTHR
ncbi:phage holin family protein [Stackebrandtia soli]|uniref:phage holin family protein n=1 Tax=Stackebrandtia soli TaxID=1892856 RepID=UPI0039E9B223